MKRIWCVSLLITSLALPAFPALADNYSDTIALFTNAGASAAYFASSYGYAVFPTIGKGGLGIGGAQGTGHVYKNSEYIGDTSMTQVSIGLQAGGQAYSQIVFFEDQRAFEEFSRGDFEFGADVAAVVITAAAEGSAGRGDICSSAL